jgi:hypothetical protein
MASIKSLKPHVPLLQRLGVDGMSSDKEDKPEKFDPHNTARYSDTYRVLAPCWHLKDLTAFLQVVDSIQLLQRHLDIGRQWDNWPCTRLYNPSNPNLSARTEFLKNLPKNAYDSKWLGAFPNITSSVNPAPEYNLTHPPEVFQYVISLRAKTGRTDKLLLVFWLCIVLDSGFFQFIRYKYMLIYTATGEIKLYLPIKQNDQLLQRSFEGTVKFKPRFLPLHLSSPLRYTPFDCSFVSSQTDDDPTPHLSRQ